MSLFDMVESPEPGLFHKSHDSQDLRIGDMVAVHLEDYPSAQAVILGCPEDEGVGRNRGRRGARYSPREIRRALYRLSATEDIQNITVFDLGNVVLGKSLEETHKRLRKVVRQILEDGKLAVVLGGGNDISYPDCAALAEVKQDFLVFNIDKHFDVRDLSPRNSGTAYRQLIEEGLIDPYRFYEMGSEDFANSPKYRKYLLKKGVHVFSLDEMRSRGMERLFDEILDASEYEAVFWGFDLDVVRDADAPGVSASYPTGLTAKEIMAIAEAAGAGTPAGVVEFTEVNPEVDIDNRTSKLTAILIHSFLNRWGGARGKENRPQAEENQ